MKLETILSAMERARFKAAQIKGYKKHDRQYRAFRARILRMDAEKDERIAELEYYLRQLKVDDDWEATNDNPNN